MLLEHFHRPKEKPLPNTRLIHPQPLATSDLLAVPGFACSGRFMKMAPYRRAGFCTQYIVKGHLFQDFIPLMAQFLGVERACSLTPPQRGSLGPD